jgi:hypothetical protein
MIWESFFDDKLDEHSNFSLWKPNNPILGIEAMPVVFRGYLLKVDKGSEGLKARLFTVTKDYLYYTRVSSTYFFKEN